MHGKTKKITFAEKKKKHRNPGILNTSKTLGVKRRDYPSGAHPGEKKGTVPQRGPRHPNVKRGGKKKKKTRDDRSSVVSHRVRRAPRNSNKKREGSQNVEPKNFFETTKEENIPPGRRCLVSFT